jgi:hypothetical protein
MVMLPSECPEPPDEQKQIREGGRAFVWKGKRGREAVDVSWDRRVHHAPSPPRTAPTSFIITSFTSTSTTTKQKVKKTTVTYYFGVLHNFIFVSSIAMTLLYI